MDSRNIDQNSLSLRPCTHISKKKSRLGPCPCLNFSEKEEDSNRCTCRHSGLEHPVVMTKDSNSSLEPPPSTQPPPPSQPQVASSSTNSTIRNLIANNISSLTQEFVAKASDEVRNGLKGIVKPGPHGVSMRQSSTQDAKSRMTGKENTLIKGAVSTKQDSSKKPAAKAMKPVAGVILNIHGIESRSHGQGEHVRVHTTWNQTTIDYYQSLNLAVIPRNGITLDGSLNHLEFSKYLLSLFPILTHVYSCEDIDSADRAPWAVCIQSYSKLIVSPFRYPDAHDVYSKRSLQSKSWDKQFIYIVTRDPIPKEIVELYCNESPDDFENYWVTLGSHEGWLDQPSDEEHDEDSNNSDDEEPTTIGSKRKRSPNDESGRQAKVLRRSARFKSPSKGKSRAVSSPIESDDEARDDSMSDVEEVSMSLLPSSSRTGLVFDPWKPDCQFTLL